MSDEACGCCLGLLDDDPAARVTRVEPKILLANERTFINWLEMATKIGSFSAALAAFGVSQAETEEYRTGVKNMASFLVVVAILFCLYSCNTFFWRRRRIRRKDDRGMDDPYGPLALASVMMITLGAVFVSALSKLNGNAAFQDVYYASFPSRDDV
eukprot:Tamp_33176.p1 GENE.Tamp_33176~~Tamp_33176.p1  ORF type:complete len:169 (-),score=23.93 Tamp_33176:134-601(-)